MSVAKKITMKEIAEKCGIDFLYDAHTVTWFGLIFFSYENQC